MKSQHRGVLWDMDGVLVDTGEFHFRAWTTALAENEIPFSRSQFKKTFGMNNEGLLKTLVGGSLAPEVSDQISSRKEELFRTVVRGQAQLLPGVHDWLIELERRGVRQAIASSAPTKNIDALIDELGIRPFFQVLVSGATLPGKPNPAVFLEAARLIGVDPRNCVVIEDAIAGVQAAKNAGMLCIAVTNTVSGSRLGQADFITESLDQLSFDTVNATK
jgi:beta-phosphoglucomutase family hydrolase